MAKTQSLNILIQDSETKDDLAEVLDGVIENIQVGAVSEAIKNKNGSGTPEGGSVLYKRFVNAELNALGTARTAEKGTSIEAATITVNINDDKEIVEEVASKDLKLYGVAGIAAKRAVNHAKRIQAYLDRKFFSTAVSAGTKFTRGALTNAKDIIDAMIVAAKGTSSDFIDGIDAEDLVLVVDGTYRKALKNELDELPNGTNPANGRIGTYDSVPVYESNRLGTGVHAVIMLNGAVALPYFVDEYTFEKINLINSYSIEAFLHCGSAALVPESIIYDADAQSSGV